MIFDILFLPFVFFIGLVTSYQDTKYGKVRNKWIFWGLLWGLGIIAFFFIWYLIASPVTHFFYFEVLGKSSDFPVAVFTVSPAYMLKVIINAAVALIIVFLMWRGGAWAAGDAKLFFVYALLIPLKYYWKSYFPYFPSFALMINIFIPIFLYLFIRAFLYFLKFNYLKMTEQKDNTDKKEISQKEKEKKKSDKKKALKERAKSMGMIFLTFITLFLIFSLLQAPIEKYFSFDITSFQMFVFAGIIIFRRVSSELFKKPILPKIIIPLLAIILIYGFISSPVATWQSLKQTVLTMIIFMTIFTLSAGLIDFYVLKTGTRKIKIGDIEPKMNLDENTINEIKKDKKFFEQHIKRIYPEGLTKKQTEAVKKWLKKSKKEEVLAYKPFPFVTWMFIGVIITLILKSSLIHLFLK